MLRHDGDNEAAAPYLRRALTLRPDSPEAKFQVGALDLANGHLEVARTELEALAKQWPDFIEAHVQLAVLYARMNRPHDSERERQIVTALNAKVRSKGPQPQVVP
jgi:predicted TPR repeat methyltransferase